MNDIKNYILEGKASLGIELGSTRIKGVLIGENAEVLAQGSHDWENHLENGVWTYSLDEVWQGVAGCYKTLKADVKEKYGATLTKTAAIGISAMMHGYIVLDSSDNQLAPFRTWRNTMTSAAADELTELFGFNIPQRWSIAHLYQSILSGEEHISKINKLMTLAAYVHYKLTGKFVLGVGDASGMFPVDESGKSYDKNMVDAFNGLLKKNGLNYTLESILPQIAVAGDNAGVLTAEGARLLDSDGELESGIKLCPPEGDAGTGMVATDSVRQNTGNISAGTSIFAMLVLDKPLSKYYREIDIAATPAGLPVAMVHCNNCSSDLNAWADIMVEFSAAAGINITRGKALDIMFEAAEKADKSCSGTVSCNYFSGEHITGFDEGRPLLARLPDAKFNLANFARSNIYAAAATVKIGMDLLLEREGVRIESLIGHGGLFMAKFAQYAIAAAAKAPVSVMKTAAEGGAWGMAILAAYSADNKALPLEDYLESHVFADAEVNTVSPDVEDIKGFEEYMQLYRGVLEVEKTAIDVIK